MSAPCRRRASADDPGTTDTCPGREPDAARGKLAPAYYRNVSDTGASPTPPETSRLIRALHAHADLRATAMTAAREKLQISQQDARALEYIALNPGVRPGVLREYLGITSAGVTTLTDRLVRRGVVSREADENDRRATHLTASIDLDVEPWSTLTAIDRELEQAIVDSDAHDVAAATDLLERLLGALGR